MFLSKIMKAQRTYAASDNILAVLMSGKQVLFNMNEKNIENANFISKVDGSIRVKFICKMNNIESYSGYFTVIEDDESIISKNWSVTDITKENPYYEIDIDFPIKKGSSYRFLGYSSTVGDIVTLNDIKLCGHVVDLSMIQYNTY